MNPLSVGVLGGSFNPIHLGHMELAKEAHIQFGLGNILLMPTSLTWYKDTSSLAGPKHRLAMARLGAKEMGEEYMRASSIDIDRGGITYTCDTVNELRDVYDNIYFIIGSDSLMYIDEWKNAGDFLKKCIILYGKRDGDDVEAISEKKKFLKQEYGADIRELKIKKIPISSSDIRKRIKSGKSITGLVPKSVEEYIMENNLYR